MKNLAVSGTVAATINDDYPNDTTTSRAYASGVVGYYIYSYTGPVMGV